MIDTDRRAALPRLPAGALPALFRALAHDRSPEEAADLVRALGFEAGDAFHRAFGDWLEERGDAPADSLPADAFWTRLAEFFSDLGWGTLRFEQPHPGVVSLAGADWVEAGDHPAARQPSCHFTTGVLADLLARVAGTDLAVMEVECRSRGDGECRFLLGGPEALRLVHERLRAGDSFQGALGGIG